MQLTDWLSTATSAAFGWITGALLGDTTTAIIGAAFGAAFAYAAARARVRPAVAVTVFVGAATGVLIGSSIVQTICLPDTCVGLEITGGVLVGFAAMVGVGMVAAQRWSVSAWLRPSSQDRSTSTTKALPKAKNLQRSGVKPEIDQQKSEPSSSGLWSEVCGLRSSQVTFPKMSDTLCPPNPNEFVIAVDISTSRAVFGT
jgi:hypothetical protein